MTDRTKASRVLVLDGAEPVPTKLACEAAANRWAVVRINTIGQALRQLREHRPRAAIVPVGPMRLNEQTELIAALRRHQPDVALVALACADDSSVERAVRTTGVACYLTLADDATELSRALRAMTQDSSETEHSGPPPPRGPGPPGRRAHLQWHDRCRN